ncbi:HlyD family efflux transporter periplasmic adaptor subunit [Cytophagaceae bacterium ABcell3]|nr:HlyD family efflux transporter periplasmic adaptor subunit [Cytophagaceae bacterium ABcell3]
MLNISPRRVKVFFKNQHLSALEVLKTPKSVKAFGKWLLILLVLIILILFLPWQQNIRGTGQVTAFSPSDRPQTVETAVAGRIEEWYFNEGDFVNKGDTLVRFSEVSQDFFDPRLIERLENQLEALKEGIQARTERIEATEAQAEALRQELQLRKSQQQNTIEQNRLTVISDSAELAAERAQLEIAETRLNRQLELRREGLAAERDVEEARLVFEERQARVAELEARLESSKNELTNAKLQLSTLVADFNSRINNALAGLGQARTDLATAREELAQLETRYTNMIIRRDQLYLRAPQNGFIVQAQRAGVGETVAEGEPLMTIMPENPSLAVQLFIRPMDIPLIDTGRHARLEFEGWPALQFTGRPNLAIGTFGGIVQVIDRVESPERGGMFRILVTPDPDDRPWPPLKVGSGVYGWVLLENVPIWYEIWRQINGFPPVIPEESYVNVGEGQIRR